MSKGSPSFECHDSACCGRCVVQLDVTSYVVDCSIVKL